MMEKVTSSRHRLVRELVRDYRGKWVAVRDERVVDHGPQLAELVFRLQQREEIGLVGVLWVPESAEIAFRVCAEARDGKMIEIIGPNSLFVERQVKEAQKSGLKAWVESTIVGDWGPVNVTPSEECGTK